MKMRILLFNIIRSRWSKSKWKYWNCISLEFNSMIEKPVTLVRWRMSISEENFDCDGNCTVDIDCDGECGGGTVVDDCGVCGETMQTKIVMGVLEMLLGWCGNGGDSSSCSLIRIWKLL